MQDIASSIRKCLKDQKDSDGRAGMNTRIQPSEATKWQRRSFFKGTNPQGQRKEKKGNRCGYV